MTRTLNVQPDQESTSRFQSRTDMMYSSVVEVRVNVEELEVRVVLLVLVLEVEVVLEVRVEPSRRLSNNGGSILEVNSFQKMLEEEGIVFIAYWLRRS